MSLQTPRLLTEYQPAVMKSSCYWSTVNYYYFFMWWKVTQMENSCQAYFNSLLFNAVDKGRLLWNINSCKNRSTTAAVSRSPDGTGGAGLKLCYVQRAQHAGWSPPRHRRGPRVPVWVWAGKSEEASFSYNPQSNYHAVLDKPCI